MSFFRRQWFLLALLLSALIGIAFPSQMLALSHLPGLRSGMVASVLFLMGITVPVRAFIHSFRSPLPGLLALALNIVAVPFFTWTFASILPLPLAGGLIVAGSVPCTLASALAWTRKGGGNEVIPMMVMLVTNGLCFAIAPLTLVLLLGRSVEIDAAEQVLRLAFLVVLPLASAGLLRMRPAIAHWADRHKLSITNFALGGILIMVGFGTAASFGGDSTASAGANSVGKATALEAGDAPLLGSGTGALNDPISTVGSRSDRSILASKDDTLGWQPILLAGIAAALAHSVVLFGAWYSTGWLGLEPADRVAVSIAGSQKTLMVGLQISLDCGVSTIPMTFYHAAQLLIDTAFVERRKRELKSAPMETQNVSDTSGTPEATQR